MRHRTPLLLLLLIALAVGCGGSEPQTKDGFIADADGACTAAADALAQDGPSDADTVAGIADENRRLAGRYEDLRDALQDVTLPAGADAAGARAYVRSVQRAAALLPALRDASDRLVATEKDEDVPGLRRAANDVRGALNRFTTAIAASNAVGIDYGLVVCGNLG